jgi:hypothetical protein
LIVKIGKTQPWKVAYIDGKSPDALKRGFKWASRRGYIPPNMTIEDFEIVPIAKVRGVQLATQIEKGLLEAFKQVHGKLGASNVNASGFPLWNLTNR